MLTNVLIVSLFILLAGLWLDGMAARERANAAAGEVCARSGISLLDGTVALSSRELARSPGGRWVLRRTYTFDYCEDGYSRSSGFIVLRGRQVEAVGLANSETERESEPGDRARLH